MEFRQTLFWDVDPNKIDPHKNAQYIIERVADFGRDNEVRWVWNFYDKSLLRKVIHNSRCLRTDTKNLWTALLKN